MTGRGRDEEWRDAICPICYGRLIRWSSRPTAATVESDWLPLAPYCTCDWLAVRCGDSILCWVKFPSLCWVGYDRENFNHYHSLSIVNIKDFGPSGECVWMVECLVQGSWGLVRFWSPVRWVNILASVLGLYTLRLTQKYSVFRLVKSTRRRLDLVSEGRSQ